MSTWSRRIAVLLFLTTAGSASAARASLTPAESCIAGAAAYHHVNVYMLTAILRVEGMRDDQVTANTNGSVDVGRGAINSVHFPDLARYGVQPSNLLDGCTNTYVAAWLVRKNLARYGNTWAAYAAYHSLTPEFNRRYQLLIARELARMGVVRGPVHSPTAGTAP